MCNPFAKTFLPYPFRQNRFAFYNLKKANRFFSKIFFFLLFVRKFFIFFIFFDFHIRSILFIFGFSSFLVGSLFGLFYSKIRIILVYSSVSLVGILFILLALGDFESILLSIFYLFMYVSVTIYFLSVLCCFGLQIFPTQLSLGLVEDIYQLQFVCYVGGFYLFQFLFVVFSVVGLPPLVIFFVKFLWLVKLCSVGFFLVFVFVMLLNFIGSYLYVRLIFYVFMFNINVVPYSVPLFLVSRVGLLRCWLMACSVLSIAFFFFIPGWVNFIYLYI